MIQKLEMTVLIDNLAEALLHLYKMTDEELDALSGEIDRTGIEHIFTGHCTGNHAFAFLKARLGERIEQFSSGFRYRFG